jgi:uncharacterized membrane protein YkvA (DUF1232 family)
MRRLFRLWRVMGSDLRLVAAALRSPGRPAWLLPAALALGFFAVEPFNFAVPFLGVVDDMILLPLLLRGLARMVAAHGGAALHAKDPRVVSVQ